MNTLLARVMVLLLGGLALLSALGLARGQWGAASAVATPVAVFRTAAANNLYLPAVIRQESPLDWGYMTFQEPRRERVRLTARLKKRRSGPTAGGWNSTAPPTVWAPPATWPSPRCCSSAACWRSS